MANVEHTHVDFGDDVHRIQLFHLLFIFVTFVAPPFEAFQKDLSSVFAESDGEGVDLRQLFWRYGHLSKGLFAYRSYVIIVHSQGGR